VKKLISILCILLALLCLCSCGPEPEQENHEPDPDIFPVKPSTGLTEKYIAGMDEYEELRMILLGCTSEDRTADDIISRAMNDWGLTFLSEIGGSHIVTGDTSDENFVYVFVPAGGTSLRISEYDPASDGPGGELYSSADGLPVIYIENSMGMDPRGLLEVERGGESCRIYTGLNVLFWQLRTSYVMGISDVTPYEEFTTAEVGDIRQMLYDTMWGTAPTVSEDMQKGYSANGMDEMMHDGHMYAIYSIDDTEGEFRYLYGVSYDQETGKFRFMESGYGDVWEDLS